MAAAATTCARPESSSNSTSLSELELENLENLENGAPAAARSTRNGAQPNTASIAGKLKELVVALVARKKGKFAVEKPKPANQTHAHTNSVSLLAVAHSSGGHSSARANNLSQAATGRRRNCRRRRSRRRQDNFYVPLEFSARKGACKRQARGRLCSITCAC